MDFEITTQPSLRTIAPPQDPAIEYEAALYFLDGHYLFRYKNGKAWAAKFVTSQDVAAAFSGSEQDSGWLPAGVVRAGSGAHGKWFVYSTPPQKVEIRFDGEEGLINIPLPRLVFLGMGSSYWMWALHAKHFDRAEPVFYAPFPNIHEGGKICWGSNTPKPADPSSAREAWELFFATPFNQHLVAGKSQAQREDVRQQLRALSGARSYPVDDLVKATTRSIGSLIDSILGDQ